MNSTRLMVLIVLCLQNSLFTVLRRYSQGVLKEDYSKHELLLVAELIKIVYSAWMISKNLKSANNDTAATSSVLSSSTSSSSSSMFVLALIYGAMNILSFISLRNISAGTFTIFAQCKILTTATFSTLILKRSYSWTKWRSLLTLMLGVLLFSEPIWGGIFSSSNNDSDSSTNSTGTGNALLGTTAVLIEVTLSGFASIYFEKVIKTDPLQLGIWERNFQLALSSVPVYLLFIIGNGGGTAGGFFTGWSILAFGLSVLGAAGGLLVALSIKYGDSILKTLATTGAIVLTGVLDHLFLGGPLTPSMIIAGLQVIISICNYTFDATVEVSAVATEAVAATATNNSPSTLKSSLTPGGGGGGDDDDDDDETELLLLRRSPMKRAEP
ncbi:Nuc_sug_transp-domain-containing protein [Fragilariopsis cylindrus CCMP1102]|uniref:Nuc_sug_transp-domain-containing protein n=1 Tax=Fragilariopsis cylindrus CCMP1102 TaxID=635003 RepID=A0A1E7ENF1_9STRA|nr:Nuc_sug_transp-domain-containing protein [Fragilariopsis cylindrus CCMP1102]|eukprot:OEU07482.1 Nuc_sug_transp-domain-containing protein [Fragilariopsis cylindrus CCMP1102]